MEKLNRKVFYKPDQEIIDKMKTVFYGCEIAVNYCNSLKIPEEIMEKNIDILYDFARDINYCNKCPGIDNCIKENPLLCTRIVYEDGFLDRQLTPCRRLLEKTRLRNQFVVMDFDDEWLKSDINKLNKSTKRSVAIKKYLAYRNKGINSWLYLTGEQNTGRSYFAATLAIDAAKKEKGPVAFLSTAQRFRQLQEMHYKNQELFQRTMDTYCSVPVLVLDDFGNEVKNDVVRDAIVYEILARRKADNLFTIFTSDFTIKEIEDMYATNKSTAPRARQIARVLKGKSEEEINLGEISIYK